MRRRRSQAVVLCATVLLTGAFVACDRGKTPRQGKSTTQSHASDQVEPTTPKPEYSFAPGLEDEFPEATSFLRRFLETCLAGDYTGYRRLVTRTGDPETRTRFEKILNSLRTLHIESIEELDAPQGPRPMYLVISRVDFLPERKVALRRGNNSRVAILVLAEDGELRMGLAPPSLQPPGDAEQPTTITTSTAPSYPWQEGGDY